MTIRCFFTGCAWRTAAIIQGREALYSQVCVRCGAKRTVSK